jgi:hypothetical protein
MHLSNWSTHLRSSFICLPGYAIHDFFSQFFHDLTRWSTTLLLLNGHLNDSHERYSGLQNKPFAMVLHPGPKKSLSMQGYRWGLAGCKWAYIAIMGCVASIKSIRRNKVGANFFTAHKIDFGWSLQLYLFIFWNSLWWGCRARMHHGYTIIKPQIAYCPGNCTGL